MSLHDPTLKELAHTLVGCEVEVTHARPDMGPFDEPFRHRGVLRGVDRYSLRFDNQWIALSAVESLKAINEGCDAKKDCHKAS